MDLEGKQTRQAQLIRFQADRIYTLSCKLFQAAFTYSFYN